MTTVLIQTIERTSNPLVMIVAMLAIAIERITIALATILAAVVMALVAMSFALASALVRAWRPLALATGLAGVVALCAAVPLLPLGLAIVALVGWVTYPRP